VVERQDSFVVEPACDFSTGEKLQANLVLAVGVQLDALSEDVPNARGDCVSAFDLVAALDVGSTSTVAGTSSTSAMVDSTEPAPLERRPAPSSPPDASSSRVATAPGTTVAGSNWKDAVSPCSSTAPTSDER